MHDFHVIICKWVKKKYDISLLGGSVPTNITRVALITKIQLEPQTLLKLITKKQSKHNEF